MKRDWNIGDTFANSTGKWRVTDVGTRVIVAIRIDEVSVEGSDPKTLSEKEASENGWFDGPPYAVAEVVFDEDDQVDLEPLVD